MRPFVGFVQEIHSANPPLYALVTVGAVILTAVTLGGLATRLLGFLGAPAREGKEVV